MIKKLMVFLAAVIMSGCSSSIVSWDTLNKDGVSSNYCSESFNKLEKVKACEAEYAALKRANVECKRDSQPGYCMIMAEHGWKRFKDMLDISAPTKEHAKMYPILCGFKENNVTACSKL